MTKEDAIKHLAELTASAAQTIADFATFMSRDYPRLAAELARGRALEPPMRAAIAAVEAFASEWPDIPVPVQPPGPVRDAAMTLITPSTRH